MRLADKVGLVQNEDQRFADIIKSWPHIQIDFFAQLLYYAKMHYITSSDFNTTTVELCNKELFGRPKIHSGTCTVRIIGVNPKKNAPRKMIKRQILVSPDW